jgi:SAM-dependent methyltransferase
MKVYDEMSEYYDLIYGDQPDSDFYMLEARNARGPVLEVGCGTGRILLKLLDAGIDATGVDLSGSMLEVLKGKAKSKGLEPDVLNADMADFSIDKKFKLIMLPYRTFCHVKSRDGRKKALLNLFEHLDKGGRLILHIYNPTKEDLEMTDDYHHFESEEMVSPEGMKYRIDWHLHYEPRQRLAHYKVVLTLDGGTTFTYRMDISFIDLREMEELLKECGYRNIRSYCGFDYYPLNEDCREVLWIAER